jgi:hypothetical protein
MSSLPPPPRYRPVDYSMDSDDDECVDDIEPVCKLERMTAAEIAQTVADIAKTAHALIEECESRWNTEIGRRVPFDSTKRIALEKQWMLHFNDLNTEYSFSPGISASDLVFEAVCWSVWCEDPSISANYTIQWLADTQAELVVYSCQHTQESRDEWPTDEQFISLRKRISGVVVQALLLGDRSVLVNDLSANLVQFKPLTEELKQAYQARKVPDVLIAKKVAELAKRKAQLIKELLAKGESTENVDKELTAIEAGEEYMGVLWRDNWADQVHSYTPLASRVVYKILSDNCLAERFKPPEGTVPTRFKKTVEAGVREWLRTRCRIEQPPELTELFRELATASFWPLGADTAKFRLRKTKDDVISSQVLLQDQIGIDLTQMLFDDALVRPSVIASDVHSPYWDWMLFAMMHFSMVREKVEWLKEYVILNPHRNDARRRLLASHHHGRRSEEMCPILVRLQRKWVLFHKGVMLPTTGTVNAFAQWWYEVQRKKEGELDNGEDVRPLAGLFIPPNPLQ